MLPTIEGTYEDGRIELEEKPEGVRRARVLVTFLAPERGDVSDATAQLLARMRAGLDLGGAPYPSREELHQRGRTER